MIVKSVSCIKQYSHNFWVEIVRQMHITEFNFVSVAKPRKVGKTGDGRNSASEAHPPPSTHQLTHSARQDNRIHQARDPPHVRRHFLAPVVLNEIPVGYARKIQSIIDVQWGQEHPNPRVHRSSRKRGLLTFPLERWTRGLGFSCQH